MEYKDVPYIVHEGDMARQERTIKRLWIALLVLIISLVGTNAGWIYYESQWQYVDTTTTSQEVTQDSGDGNITGNTIINGEAGH